LARSVEPVAVEAGEDVVVQGEPGDRYYAIAEGDLEVLVDDVPVRILSRCEGFGEVALMRHCPRTGTVRAVTPAELYALEGRRFLEVVTGHAGVAAAAAAVVEERRRPDDVVSDDGVLQRAEPVGAHRDDVAGLDPAVAVERSELE
jgi:CRP-like cAMP-binding protein